MNADVIGSHASNRLLGAVDYYVPPRMLLGWVHTPDLSGDGSDLRLFVFFQDRLIAKGATSRSRRDIAKKPKYLSGFSLFCSEDVPDEAIAFSQLRVEARDCAGRQAVLPIWDRVRAGALERVINAADRLGKDSAVAALRGIAHNSWLAPQVREAILQVCDDHLNAKNQLLMYRFEDLGRDCSLGGIQRAYRAEPLGLLRFSGIDIDAVTTAIQNRFRGVGSPEFTVLRVGPNREYFTQDKRYFMSAHTFVYENDIEHDLFLRQQCKKISFLVRNMLEKLEEGEKIFVVHKLPDRIPDAKLRKLQAAIRAHGPSPLLYLEASSPECPAGTVTMRGDGILTGYVKPLSGELLKPPADVLESWLTVLRKADALMPPQNRAPSQELAYSRPPPAPRPA